MAGVKRQKATGMPAHHPALHAAVRLSHYAIGDHTKPGALVVEALKLIKKMEQQINSIRCMPARKRQL